MATYYDLWDIGSGNCIGTFRTRDEALSMVAALLDANGDDYADDLDLGQIDNERFQLIATGAPLLKMARDVATNIVLTSVGGNER